MRSLSAFLSVPLLVLLAACAGEAGPADAFMERLETLCGKAFEGRVVSDDPQDEGIAAQPLVMHVRECRENEIRIPFHVGENRSRTWVITRTEEGVRLKHDHRHEDGAPDAVTNYGGDSAHVSAGRAEFPVDQESIELFQQEELDASVTNIWAVDVNEEIFAYELSREGRFFRVEFDLTTPVDASPPPWGAQG